MSWGRKIRQYGRKNTEKRQTSIIKLLGIEYLGISLIIFHISLKNFKNLRKNLTNKLTAHKMINGLTLTKYRKNCTN